MGLVAYNIALLLGLSRVHLVFHISMHKRYHRDGDYIIKCDLVLLNKYLAYKEELMVILDRDV